MGDVGRKKETGASNRRQTIAWLFSSHSQDADTVHGRRWQAFTGLSFLVRLGRSKMSATYKNI
jgi:hypothetical protein